MKPTISDLEHENGRLKTALRWFVDRQSAIQAKFDLYGPVDLAEALKKNYRRARKALEL